MSNSLVTPWTVAYQAPLSTEFSRQEYWSGSPFPSPGDLPDPGIKPGSPALQADSYHLSHKRIPTSLWYEVIFSYSLEKKLKVTSALGPLSGRQSDAFCSLAADRNKQRCKDRTQREEIWRCSAPSLFFLADRILFSDRIGPGSCENFINI